MSREPETNASRGDSEAKPFPKAAQLARGERRYRRKVATAKAWQAIVTEKLGPCRVCVSPAANGGYDASPQPIEFHHLVSWAQGGDDVPANIVPLCSAHHGLVTRRDGLALSMLAASLTDAEREYVTGKLGPAAFERLYGVGR